jgi:putative Holliday junction resolvase
MKYLGIDYGTKRVGLAVGHSETGMAFPLRVVAVSDALLSDIATIVRDEAIEAIVIGQSLNFANEPNPLMKKITPFAEALRVATHLPVSFMNEALSSREAMHLQGDNAQNDASAAAIVLQSYLDLVASKDSGSSDSADDDARA